MTFTTLERSSVATVPGTCAAGPPTPVLGTRTTATRSGVWWWPLRDGRPTLEVGGRHTGRVVSRETIRSLRIDDTGLTVLDGDTVRRYAWVSVG